MSLPPAFDRVPPLPNMIAVEQVARGWSGFLPAELAELFSRAEAMDANAAEESLTGLIDEHGDEPELWWMLGLTMCRQQDEINAEVCHDNFIVRVSHQIGLACEEAGHAAPIAIQRLQRLLPSLDRAGAVLAARGHIARAGLQLAEGFRIGAADSQAEALYWLRRASPRPWPIAAEWLATEAVRRSGNGITYRTARTLRLAARLSRHAPEARDRTVMILRDLGLVLDRTGAVAAAEAALVEARTALDPKRYPDLAAGVAAALAENLAGQRRYLEAQAEVEAALALAASPRERANALRIAADLLVTVGRAHRAREQLIEARAHADEAIELLVEIDEDRLGAVIQRATIDALLGETVAARGELTKLLSNMSLRSLPLATRSGLSYLAWLLRFTAGQHAKALRWARRRLRDAAADGPRARLFLREHVVLSAAHLGDTATIREQALVMWAEESAMLATAFGTSRGPADWNRMRLARECLATLAWCERACTDPEAPWRQAEALLVGRGTARASRRAGRLGASIPPVFADLRSIAAQLAPRSALLAMVALHPPGPSDPVFPWSSRFDPPQLVTILLESGAEAPLIVDGGLFAAAEAQAERWREGIAVDEEEEPPEAVAQIAARLANLETIWFVAEGALEAMPLALVAPQARIIHGCDAVSARDVGRGGGALVVISKDFWCGDLADEAAGREAAAVRSALPRASVLGGPAATAEQFESQLAAGPGLVHVIAHGRALRHPDMVPLDVYEGAALSLGRGQDISASRIAELSLDRTALVVLSLCDSNIGVVQYSEGMASLAAAFRDAGAHQVIAAQWPVPHDTTARFMELLYGESLADPALALVRARATAQTEGLPDSAWAGWILQGPFTA